MGSADGRARPGMARPARARQLDREVGLARVRVRDVSLFVDVVGQGDPLLLMHGGPGADHWTMTALRPLADERTLVFYDHRCNGRSEQAPVESMTWDNLTADADALRASLGFERWAVLGHSFGGMVALEYALRYPNRLTDLILLDTGGDGRLSTEGAAAELARRGATPEKVELVRRWFNGQFEPREMTRILLRIGDAYASHPSLRHTIRDLAHGEWRTRMRPEALIFAGRQLLPGWSVMDRLAEITTPTLIIAGRDDFIFPPAHQQALAAGIPNARLRLVDDAGHNAHTEQARVVLDAFRRFLRGSSPNETPRHGATPGRS
jgi:proline-specific peptidase